MAGGPLPAIRRIITEEGADGRSRIVADGPSPSVRTVAERPGYRITNLWRTPASPSINEPDAIAQHQGLSPLKGGTVLRVVDYPPEAGDVAERKRQQAASFGQLFKDAEHRLENKKHPGMHRTETIDYAIVLSGEITMMLDDHDVTLKQGDVVVQCGTNHAWSNRSQQPCVIAFILIDGKFDPELKETLDPARSP
jgi:quercetin dioxygenase-like cupin family protein